ncbi:hypothetical protein [Viridibacterium curvum]|uniref:Uncharacterized protein n=1 Tax=Viridibacterium curvum TaxID=1101404 RepID=A0ABP9QBR5_9RHOO
MKIVKTSLGMAALADRDKRLSSKVRMLLVTVDGTIDRAELRKIAMNIGAPADAVDTLFALDLVAEERASDASPEAPAESANEGGETARDAFGRLRMGAAIMNELASDVLGLKAFFFVLKVEKCGNVAELAQLLPGLEAAVIKAHGSEAGARLLDPLRRLLA